MYSNVSLECRWYVWSQGVMAKGDWTYPPVREKEKKYGFLFSKLWYDISIPLGMANWWKDTVSVRGEIGKKDAYDDYQWEGSWKLKVSPIFQRVSIQYYTRSPFTIIRVGGSCCCGCVICHTSVRCKASGEEGDRTETKIDNQPESIPVTDGSRPITAK